MSNPVKPMLATAVENLDVLKYPVLVSPKLDGIRCLIIDGVAMSRSLKPIPSKHVQEWVKQHAHILNGMDGELIVGDVTAKDVFNVTTSGVMKKDGSEQFTFYVFDLYNVASGTLGGAHARWFAIKCILEAADVPNVVAVEKYVAFSPEQVLEVETSFLDEGYEGAMIQGEHSEYKYGRSTVKEQKLLKLKRFVDSEFKIVGFEELMHNDN